VGRYSQILGRDRATLLNTDVRQSLHNILNRVRDCKQTVFMLVDEIDVGASWVISQFLVDGPSQPSSSVAKHLFGIVKDVNFSDVLVRGFATGISTLHVKDVLTLSVWQDISRNDRVSEMYGLNFEDISSVLHKHAPNDSHKLLEHFIQKTQNGYRFSANPKLPSVYNTSLALKIITAFIAKQDWQMTDTADVIPHKILDLLGKLPSLMEVVKEALQGDLPVPPTIDKYIESMVQLADKENCVRFLFSVGFLTYSYYRDSLTIPNLDIEMLMHRAYLYWSNPDKVAGFAKLKMCAEGLFQGHITEFAKFVESSTFQTLNPSQDARIATELTFKVALLPYFSWAQAYFVDSENRAESGRIDIWCEVLSTVRPVVPQYRDMVIELKRIPLNTLRIRNKNTSPSTADLRRMSFDELRTNLEVSYFGPWESMQQYEQKTITQAMDYGLSKSRRSAQKVRPLIISFICLGWARILYSTQEITVMEM